MQIIGQRGASGHAPENTSAAIRKAIHQGVSAIQVDIQYTRDGEPVVFRDRTLEAAAGVRGRIRDQSLRELSGYDIGFKRGSEFRGLRLLSLDEAAALVPPEIQLHLTLQGEESVSSRHLKELITVIRRRGGLQRCLISSEDYKVLTSLRDLERRCRRGLIARGTPAGRPAEAAKLGCEALYAEGRFADEKLAEECRESGVELIAYDVQDAALMKRLAEMGVSGIAGGSPERISEATGVTPKPGKPVERGRPPRRRGRGRTARAPEPKEAVEATAPEPVPEKIQTEPVESTAPKKRRRGRRGGKKVRERRERKEAASRNAGTEPVSREEGPEPAPAPPAEVEGSEKTEPASSRPRHRRGRRGGRRNRSKSSGNGGGGSAGESGQPA